MNCLHCRALIEGPPLCVALATDDGAGTLLLRFCRPECVFGHAAGRGIRVARFVVWLGKGPVDPPAKEPAP